VSDVRSAGVLGLRHSRRYDYCVAYNAAQNSRISAGLCMDCGTLRGPDGTTVNCRSCALKKSRRASDRSARLRLEWRANESLCNSCGKTLTDVGFKTCGDCRTSARARLKRHVGRRGYAPSMVERTPEMRERRRLASQARRGRYSAEGRCLSCGKPKTHASLYCRKHWLANVMRKYKIPAVDSDTLWLKLEKQGFRCYYTGIEITPGLNASLDHRVPRSRGGDLADLDNYVWCDRLINAFKNDLTEAEFVDRCRSVVSRFG